MHRAAGELPDQPGINGAEQQLSPLRTFPCTRHVIQNPLDLGTGKIGINHKSGFVPISFGQSFFLQCITFRCGAPALPDNRMINRFSGFPIPYHCGFALIGDSDRRNLLRGNAKLLYRLPCHGQLGAPDLLCIVLYPARLWEILRKLLLCHCAHLSAVIEQNAAAAGGTGIQRHNILFHTGSPFRVIYK